MWISLKLVVEKGSAKHSLSKNISLTLVLDTLNKSEYLKPQNCWMSIKISEEQLSNSFYFEHIHQFEERTHDRKKKHKQIWQIKV